MCRKLDHEITDKALGFRNGVRARQEVFDINVLMRKFLAKYQKIYACFIKCEKAFANVKKNKLTRILKVIYVGNNDIRNINNQYQRHSFKKIKLLHCYIDIITFKLCISKPHVIVN